MQILKKGYKVILVALALVVVAIAGSLVYMAVPVANIDSEALDDTEYVKVNVEEDYIFFDGSGQDAVFVFYPGGRVDYIAYSSLMKEIAKEGVDCYVLKMPVNFALLGINKAQNILNTTEYSHYYAGGHSLGGVAASMYLEDHADLFDGIIYLASYTNVDLRDTDLKVLMIRGSLDGLVEESAEVDSLALLPSDAVYQTIEGGNHAQYGTYGKQSGDNEATISNEEQIAITAKMIIEFIKEN